MAGAEGLAPVRGRSEACVQREGGGVESLGGWFVVS
jgi:hypothetical protein